MARRQLLGKSLPRVELDHHARDARDRLVKMERLLVPRASSGGFLAQPVCPASRITGREQPGQQCQGARVGDRSAPWLLSKLLCVRLIKPQRLCGFRVRSVEHLLHGGSSARTAP